MENLNIPLPDLRFEQSFMKQLRGYAVNTSKRRPLNEKELAEINEIEVDLVNKRLDIAEKEELEQPLAPITPNIVIYAIIKDQVLMPLLQGLVFTGFFILAKPFLRAIVNHGQHFGGYLATILGVNQFTQPSVYI